LTAGNRDAYNLVPGPQSLGPTRRAREANRWIPLED